MLRLPGAVADFDSLTAFKVLEFDAAIEKALLMFPSPRQREIE